MDETLSLRELEHLYAWLLPQERDELLQCLLIAASRGGEAMIEVLEQTLLSHAVDELCEEHDDPRRATADDSEKCDPEEG